MLLYSINHTIFVSVFHRILDFKAGLDFYLGPFFLYETPNYTIEIIPSLLNITCCSPCK